MKTSHQPIRSGFTLIELLVVIGLIVIMVSILGTALRGVFGTTRQAATKSTVIKISRMLEDRIEAFHRYMDRLDKKAGINRPPQGIVEITIVIEVCQCGS